MAYVVAPQEIEILKALARGENPGGLYPDTLKPKANAYNYLYNLLGGDSGPVSAEVASVWNWVKGAEQVNRDIGPFNEFIRDYTAAQFEIRYGVIIGDAELQVASDDIADEVIESIDISVGVVPSITEIGLFDATAVTTALQNYVPSGSEADFALWSGNPLFVLLNEPRFLYENIITSDKGTYDLLAMFEAIGRALPGFFSVASLSDIFSQFADILQIDAIDNSATFFSARQALEDFWAESYSAPGLSLDDFLTLAWQDIFVAQQDNGGVITINSGAGIVHAGDKDDDIRLNAGAAIIDGGTGDDSIEFETKNPLKLKLEDRESREKFSGEISEKTLDTGGLFDIRWERADLYNIENITLSELADEVVVQSFANLVEGISIDGGDGDDEADFSAVEKYIQLNLGQDEQITFLSGGDTLELRSFEDVELTGYADLLVVDSSADLSGFTELVIDFGSSGGSPGFIDGVSAAFRADGVVIDLSLDTQRLSGGGGYVQFTNAQGAVGGDGFDTLIAGENGLYLEGGGGADVITAGRNTQIVYTGTKENDIHIDDQEAEIVELSGGATIVYLGVNDTVSGDASLASLRRPNEDVPLPSVQGFSIASLTTTASLITTSKIASGVLLTGGEAKAPPIDPCAPSNGSDSDDGKTYIASDGTRYTLESEKLTVSFGSGSVYVEAFTNGNAGIRLKDARPDLDQAECLRDPLIIDLDGNRNVITELFDSTAYFDLDNDGFAEHVAWALPSDGFLVRDLNGNGTIDSGSEMFGTGRAEQQADDTRLFGTAGFDELALLDSNLDRVIDARDVDFNTLQVWVDANGDARTDDGELKSLDELGIVSISLAYFNSDDLDCGCDGTEILTASTVTFAGGDMRNIYDAYLSIDQYDAREVLSDDVDTSYLDGLPVLLGTGNLSDLAIAMTRDPALEEMVRGFASLDVSRAADITGCVETILLRWTGADDVATDSRGPNIDARILHALETITGSPFEQAVIGMNPRADAAAILKAEWQEVLQNTTAKLLGQTELGEILMPQLRFAAAAFYQADAGTRLADVIAELGRHAPDEPVAGLKYWHTMISTVLKYGGALGVEQSDILAAFDASYATDAIPLNAFELTRLRVAEEDGEYLLGSKASTLTNPGFGRNVGLADADNVILGGGRSDDVFILHSGTSNVKTAALSSNDKLVLLDIDRADLAVEGRILSIPQRMTSIEDLRFEVTMRSLTGEWSFSFEIPVFDAGISQAGGSVVFADVGEVSIADLLGEVQFTSPIGNAYFITGAQTADQGSAGDDVVIGSQASDTFVFVPGQGTDLFVDTNSAGSDVDTLSIGALRSEVAFSIDEGGANLRVTTADSDAILLGQYGDLARIEQFIFADGETVSADVIGRELLTGTAGADSIVGTIGADVIDGRGGGDTLRGGYGADTYVFSAGYGGVRIEDGLGSDRIALADFSTGDAVVLRSGGNIVISLGDGSDSISIAGDQTQFLLDFADRTISAGGLLLERGQIGNPAQGNAIFGSPFSDYDLYGTAGADVFYGLGAYDLIYGGEGDDTYVYAGENWIDFFEDGGFDVVRPTAQFTRDHVILLDGGIAFEGEVFGFVNHDNSYDNATGLPRYGDLTIEALVFADGRVVDFTSGWKDVGTTGDDILFNFGNFESTFTPGEGNDRIFSYGPNYLKTVVLEENFGHDVWYQEDNFRIDMTAFAYDARIGLARDGNDLVITVDGDANSFTLRDAFHPYKTATVTTVRNAGSTVEFAGGVVLGLADVAAAISVATDGDDILFGRATLDGGAGNDTLIGDNAANVYHYGRGYGDDVIKEENRGNDEFLVDDRLILHGLNPDDVKFERHPDDPKSILMTILDTGETLVIDGTPWDAYRYIDRDLDLWTENNDRNGVHSIERIEFADGTVIAQSEIEQRIIDSEATDGNDVVVSFGAPEIASRLPAAYVHGGAGDDLLINDYKHVFVRFEANSGNDTLLNSFAITADVTIQLVGLTFADLYVEYEARGGEAFTVLKSGTGSSLAIEHGMITSRKLLVVDENGNEREIFQSGGFLGTNIPTDGDDFLVSGIANATVGASTRPNAIVDIFQGGAGNDVIQGYAGNDIVRFGRGDGTDTLLEGRPMGQFRNQPQFYTIEFDGDVLRQDVAVSWETDRSGLIAVTILDTGDKLVLDPGTLSALVFADGTRVQQRSTGNGAEIIDLNALLPQATAGDDTLLLRAGRRISGGAGDDTIIFIGGRFEYGDIEFGRGDGHDVFMNREAVDQDGDRFYNMLNTSHRLFLRDVDSLDELRFTQDGNDLIIEIIDTGDTLRLVNQLFEEDRGYTDYNVREIYLANGAYVPFSRVHPRIERDDTPAADQTIVTGDAGGILDGGAGADLLLGGTGRDSYILGRGFDEDIVRDAGGIDALFFEEGVTREDVVFSRTGDGDDLLIEVLGTDRLSLTIENQFSLTSAQIETFRFSDGSVLDIDDVNASILRDSGTSQDDDITGFATADDIVGLAGNDRLAGLGGDDAIDGGTGRDTAILRGSSTDYEITSDGTTLTVRDLVNGRDGTDTLVSVENLYFAGDGVTLSLSPPNQGPTAGDLSVSVAEDRELLIARADILVLASDTDGDALTLSLGGAVNGQAWIDLAGNIRFRSLANFNGDASFQYTVKDPNGGTASGTVGVTVVGENDAPVIDIGLLQDLFASEDTPFAFSLPDTLASDADGDAVSLLVRQADGSPLPDWFALVDGVLTGTPPADFSGEVALQLVASDGQLSTTAPFTLKVLDRNDAPRVVVDQGDVNVTPGQTLALAIGASNFVDPEGDAIAVEVLLADGSALPTWLTYDGTTLTGTVPAGFSDTLTLAILASDGSMGVVDAFALVPASNLPPVLANPLASVSFDEDTFVSWQGPSGTFSDPEGTLLTYFLNLSDGSPLPSWLSFDGELLIGTPPADFNGSLSIEVVASDGEFTASDILDLTITPVNDAPTLANPLPEIEVTVGDSLDSPIPTDTFTDVDGDTLVLNATLSDGSPLPAWLSFDGTRFQGIAPAGSAGIVDVRVTASDGQLSAGDDITLTITASNVPPIANDDGLFIGVQAQDLVILASDLLANDTDQDGDPLSIVSVSNGASGTVTFDANGNLVFSASGAFTGVDSFSYTISDGTEMATATVSLRIDSLYDGWSQGGPGDDKLFGNHGDENSIFGAGGNDHIKGGKFNDMLAGGSGDDKIQGLSGDDKLWGNAGNDELIGNGGFDTAYYFGDCATYSIFVSDGQLYITDNDPIADGDDGTDTLDSIELLSFKNGQTVSLVSPVIIDIGNDGITTLSSRANHARIDLDGDGRADDTSWIGKTDAFLFLDRNGDGTFSGVAEMSFIDDLPGAATDLEGLAAFDSNRDGRLDSGDERFDAFKLWNDRNGNGHVEVKEILSLTEAGIQSINLAGTAVEAGYGFGEVVVVNEGNLVRIDGSEGLLYDAALSYFSGTAPMFGLLDIFDGPLIRDFDGRHRGEWRELFLREKFDDIGFPRMREVSGRAAELEQDFFTQMEAGAVSESDDMSVKLSTPEMIAQFGLAGSELLFGAHTDFNADLWGIFDQQGRFDLSLDHGYFIA